MFKARYRKLKVHTVLNKKIGASNPECFILEKCTTYFFPKPKIRILDCRVLMIAFI